MSGWCWHRWGKWKTTDEGEHIRVQDPLTLRLLDEKERYVYGYFERQRRECEKCGACQLRKVIA